MSIIRDVEHPSRIEAIIVMSKLDKEEIGVPEIASILNEEDPQMRSASALALGEYGEAASGYVPRLIPLLNSTAQRYQSVTLHVAESVPLRRDIAEAIGLIGKGAGAALPELRRMAQADDDGRARVAAAVAIARISGDNAIAIETIRDVLQHGRPIDQMAATFAIGPIGQDALPLMSIVIDAYQKPGGDALFVDMLASFEALGPLAKDFLPFLRELSQQSSTALDRSIISDAIRSIEGRSE